MYNECMSDSPSLDTNNLRPQSLKDYLGQENAVKTLRLFIDAVKQRGQATEHILFYGPPGIGKTTLAYIIANELVGDIKITSGAALTKTGDLAAILTNLKDNDVLFIDEIHRMPKPLEEMLYPVMEEFALDIIIGKGPSARTVRLPVPNITIVGATTKLALLSGPLRDRFGLLLRLDYYTEHEMMEIVERSAKLLKLPITRDAAREIARRSRHTPRIANRIIKRARAVMDVHKHEELDEEVIKKLFSLLEIDELGLTDMDNKYLRLLAEKFNNTAVGVETIAHALAEDRRTVEEFLEPYLMQLGLMKKTARGRVLTPAGYRHLKLKPPANDPDQPALV